MAEDENEEEGGDAENHGEEAALIESAEVPEELHGDDELVPPEVEADFDQNDDVGPDAFEDGGEAAAEAEEEVGVEGVDEATHGNVQDPTEQATEQQEPPAAEEAEEDGGTEPEPSTTALPRTPEAQAQASAEDIDNSYDQPAVAEPETEEAVDGELGDEGGDEKVEPPVEEGFQHGMS